MKYVLKSLDEAALVLGHMGYELPRPLRRLHTVLGHLAMWGAL